MIVGFLAPGVVAVICASACAAAHRRLRPSSAAWLLTAAGVAAAAAIWLAMIMTGLAFIAERPGVAAWLGWCVDLLGHRHVPMWAGVLAWSAMLVIAVGAARRLYRQRTSRTDFPVGVIADRHAMAFAVPGRRRSTGHVVVSTGMLDVLRPDEQEVVLAHETAHLRRGHHRFVFVAEFSASMLPLLRPLAARVRLATERWADEDAAEAVGDRRVVARAIARAAIAGAEAPAARLAFGGGDVMARIEAMLDPAPSAGFGPRSWALSVAAMVAVGVAGSVVQLHHVVEVLRHVCAGA